MLLSNYEYSVDEKGRLAIPAKFRPELGARLVLTRGFDGCLVAYPLDEWQRFTEKLSALSPLQSDERVVVRTTLAYAYELELDRQGRILIPADLRDYADISDGVVFAGMYSRVEIWSKEHWLEQEALMRERAGEIADRVRLPG